MNLAKSIKNILNSLYLSLKRFPLTMVLSAFVAATLIIISEVNPSGDTLKKVAMILALGMPLSLCIKLFFEKQNKESFYTLLLGYIGGGLLLLFYYLLFLKTMGMVTISRYTGVSLTLYLGFLFIPYFLKKEEFEMYVITVFTSFFITILYSIVLYAGLSAILFTVDHLLQIRILGKVYYYTWLFVVFIFALSYFLAQIPPKNHRLTPKSYPKLLRILLLYIVMPLLTAYTLILYIYFGKIIVTMQWPVGLVSHLVLWYSIIVTAVLFFITPIKEENSWSNLFLKVVPKSILPLLIMMFISISIRIKAYGVTENRYYVIILALWVFLILFYFSFAKKLRNILIPVTLSIVAFISVLGPLSSYSISMRSQNTRLERILMKNNILTNGNLQSSTDVSKEDQIQVSSILTYFNQNHSLKNVKYLPANFKLEDMNKVLGFPLENPTGNYNNGFFNFTRTHVEKAIDIKDYEYLVDMRSLNNDKTSAPFDLSYNYESATIKINHLGREIYNKNLDSFIKALTDKYGISSNTVAPDEMTLIEENEKIKVKFIFINISGNKNQSTQRIDSHGIDFYILVKIK